MIMSESRFSVTHINEDYVYVWDDKLKETTRLFFENWELNGFYYGSLLNNINYVEWLILHDEIKYYVQVYRYADMNMNGQFLMAKLLRK